MNTLTFETIAAILKKEFQVPADAIHPETALVDLGLDSLALMEFVFAVEDAFHLRIPEEKLDVRASSIRLRQLCELLEQSGAPTGAGTHQT